MSEYLACMYVCVVLHAHRGQKRASDPSWRRCDLVGGSVPLGVGFEVLEAQASPSGSFFLLPVGPDTELAAPSPAPYLPLCLHTSWNDDNGVIL